MHTVTIIYMDGNSESVSGVRTCPNRDGDEYVVYDSNNNVQHYFVKRNVRKMIYGLSQK
jgi:hypothetical protein